MYFDTGNKNTCPQCGTNLRSYGVKEGDHIRCLRCNHKAKKES